MWAQRLDQIADPTVRDLLSLTNKSNIISLAGGVPAPEALATHKINQILKTNTHWSLQYGEAGGLKPLRQTIANWLTQKWNHHINWQQVLITAGSQQALDLVARALINPQDKIGVEDPTYFVALYAFGAYNPQYQIINLDDLKPDQFHQLKLIYLVPNFQNPTGKVLSSIAREHLRQLSKQTDTWIIEDDPYGELYYQTKPPKPIFVGAQTKAIYIGSFSKILAPGLRVGYLVADESTIEVLERVKTGMDLCLPGIVQDLVRTCLQDQTWWQQHLQKVRRFYHQKATWMQQALTNHLSSLAHWQSIAGGMFYWLQLPEIDTQLMFQQALQQGVAYVPGYIFRPFRERSDWLRLSFATASHSDIDQGIKRLQQVILANQKL